MTVALVPVACVTPRDLLSCPGLVARIPYSGPAAEVVAGNGQVPDFPACTRSEGSQTPVVHVVYDPLVLDLLKDWHRFTFPHVRL